MIKEDEKNRVGGFRPQGFYSLLTDKNNTSIIARKPDGRPIPNVSGGCDENSFCSQVQPLLKNVIQLRSGDESVEPTAKQQGIYRELWREGHVRITNNHAENVFVMPPDWRDMP